ncbi:MAG: hypothetical protein Q7R50_02400 [Dehalococcoidales bacterium]|nr:hypothetical protein [Dehalococcoidales bacterium]
MPKLELDQLRAVSDLPSLVGYLRDQLEWPIEDANTDDLTFEWSADTLRVAEHHASALSSGQIRQLRRVTTSQPWGIFLVEFNDDSVHSGLLREILRGLAANRRHAPHLPGWEHDNLLFICATKDYNRITFAHFRGEKMQKARLAMFGWQRDNPYLRTLCEFNLPHLRWPDDPADTAGWLKIWASAFDKEPLTREFFKRFEKALGVIKADLEKLQNMSSAKAYSSAQLLLERLLFLYFLQNRGWLNRQRNYLLAGFATHRERSNECSYYAEFLERLFFTLATAPGTASAYQLEGIPFLNGGLFDDDEFPSPSSTGRKAFPPLLIRNSTFVSVFDDLLEAFNFTVREDTPLDQDVAVDPEMLGKVFESIVLHAEATAEYNAPDKRKATGSYYTPRIVVHFICREALRLHLRGQLPGAEWEAKIRTLFDLDVTSGIEAEEFGLLKTAFKPADGSILLDIVGRIRMCDPAVGSGAFPVGLLHELVNIRRIAKTVANGFVDPVRREGSNWIHQAKADIVENCLHGVDIQQQAIEICRLRLWLSLIVDYDLGLDPFAADPAQFRQAIQKISQLPNLEMNFRRGDSLLDYICGVNVRVAPEKSERYHKEFVKIHDLGVKLHHEKKSGRKRELRLDILRCRLELSERVLRDEIKSIGNANSQLTLSIVSATDSETAKHRQVEQETGRLQKALQEVAANQKSVEKIASRTFDVRFYPELRKLEGADFDSPFNFSWRIDFADIFQGADGGFDIILGNPPFVTARNPEKRELYRERWKRVCHGAYLLVAPFFNLSFDLLRPGGQLGFIVSNAFAKREFGKPLVEDFFPTVEVQKIVDCSGLMFPGHGTPTCIVFGQNEKPAENSNIQIAAIRPGGGDLRTIPEESPLWHTLEAHHDQSGYIDDRISVSSRPRTEMAKWPWNFDSSSQSTKMLIDNSSLLLSEVVNGVGYSVLTKSDDIFFLPAHTARIFRIEGQVLQAVNVGDEIRNWSYRDTFVAIFPYDSDFRAIKINEYPNVKKFLLPFRSKLESVITFGQTKQEAGRQWFEYFCPYEERHKIQTTIAFSDITTHNHFVTFTIHRLFKDTAPMVILKNKEDSNLLSGLLNSSSALFWFKQVCFSKRESEEGAKDTYFEFAGGKVQQLPVPDTIADAMRGNISENTKCLISMAYACWKCGHQLPALTMKKIFEKPGDGYYDWDAKLPGNIVPDSRLGQPFQTAKELKTAFSYACDIREQLRNGMIALQEEMDWLVYDAYGLLPANSKAVGRVTTPSPLAREQRPFALWQESEENFDKAISLIPTEWSTERNLLWSERLSAISENEHIRRIEQPEYKRRWDEQWKVGNRWQCGQVAYNAELSDAFDWWLYEKAEWWLEKQRNGGPVSLREWTAAIWQDGRVQAGWEGVRGILGLSAERDEFSRHFSTLIKDQTVPVNIPFAIPWEAIEGDVPASAKRIRGKLNVPRERFRINDSGEYVWAGKR